MPAYNEAEYLPSTLDQLNAILQEIPGGEIIVVDNDSTDETISVARARGARVISEEMRQISRVRNTGAQHARSKFLVFVDADTHVPMDVMRKALELMRAGCAGGGALSRYEDERSIYGALTAAVWRFLSSHLKLAAGHFFFVQKTAFDACGGFSEKLYAAEDVDLSRRIKRWARIKNASFEIIPDTILTSSRKMRWFSPARLWFALFFFTLFPAAVRFKSLCGFWYQRPRAR